LATSPSDCRASLSRLRRARHAEADGVTAPSGGYSGGTQSFKIIVGGYQQRINLIQQAMARIMQSGVQVALIN
jgi:hypothetical protein